MAASRVTLMVLCGGTLRSRWMVDGRNGGSGNMVSPR